MKCIQARQCFEQKSQGHRKIVHLHRGHVGQVSKDRSFHALVYLGSIDMDGV